MGAKTGYADVILRCMGLRRGQGADHYLWCEPDAGVRLLLHAYRDRELATAAADIIRSWKDEEPRALWERLRAEGPAQCPPMDAREVARWVLQEGWTNSGRYMGPDRPSNCHGEGWTASITRAGLTSRLDAAPALPATIADDARKVDPREVARLLTIMRWAYANVPIGHNGERFTIPANGPDAPLTFGANNFGTTETTATGLDKAPTLPATIADDARAIDPPQLPPGTVAYADVPYQGTTSYADAFPRSEWLPVVRRWREAGALVVVSEAEPIPDLMAEGWHAVEITGERKGQKRTFGGTREWLTMSEPPRWRPSVQFTLFGAPVTHSTGRD